MKPSKQVRIDSKQASILADEGRNETIPSLDTQDPSVDLLQLYKDWVKYYVSRDTLYKDRLTAAKESLLDDIERWSGALASSQENKLLRHHTIQFGKFVNKAYAALVTSSSNLLKGEPTEALDFEALVIGVLTAQWLLLRDVVTQRMEGSPYLTHIRTFDKKATENYARLYAVVTKRVNKTKLNKKYRAQPLAHFTPLVYLGNGGELTVFNRRVPLMLSIPLGALPKMSQTDGGDFLTGSLQLTKLRPADYAQMSIPHEISHAVFSQVPELIEEIKEQLTHDLKTGKLVPGADAQAISPRDALLYQMAIEWTEEICADLWGTALAGQQFAESALWTMAASTSTTGLTDKSHPPAIVRPIVHLSALSVLETDQERYDQTRAYFIEEINKSAAKSQIGRDLSLERRFRSVPALMFVSMETLIPILDRVVQHILNLQLKTLKNKTMTEIMRDIRDSATDALPDLELPTWGEDAEITNATFVLDFPAELIPSYTMPGVSILPDFSDLPIIRDVIKLFKG